jgi:hypothetical protein
MHKTVKLVIISMFELVYIAFVTVRGIGTPGSDWTSTPKSTSPFCGGHSSFVWRARSLQSILHKDNIY